MITSDGESSTMELLGAIIRILNLSQSFFVKHNIYVIFDHMFFIFCKEFEICELHVFFAVF